MKIQEFDEKFNFHDSDIHSINYDVKAKALTIVFDFCYWMQSDYEKDRPENGLLKVIFNDVDSYDGVTGENKYEYWSVLDGDIKDGKYHLFIEDTSSGGSNSPKYRDIYILADNVEVEDLREK